MVAVTASRPSEVTTFDKFLKIHQNYIRTDSEDINVLDLKYIDIANATGHGLSYLALQSGGGYATDDKNWRR